jgi:FkbM family methyltransferase
LLHDSAKITEKIIDDNLDRVEITDPGYFGNIESCNYRALLFSTMDKSEKSEFEKKSKDNYSEFLKSVSGRNKAVCFTSGPSFDRYREFDYTGMVKIICNSIVKNDEFLDFIEKSDLLVFADPVFHFGVSEYADKFRSDAVAVIKRYNTYVMVPDFAAPLLAGNFPEISDKIIGMPIKVNEGYNFPSAEKFYVKNTANILTLFMLPVASAVAEKIYVIGADGRKKGENYFWQHNKKAQYHDELETAKQCHPSFFRDRDYEDYYDEHIAIMEELINYGECAGKKYRSLTPAYTEPLGKRYVPNPGSGLFKKVKEFNEAHEHIDEVKLLHNFLPDLDINKKLFYVGAHQGSSLRYFLENNWQVFAFEPDNKNRSVLEKKFEGMANLNIDTRAVSDKTESGKSFFTSNVSTGISGLSSFHESHKQSQKVDTVTIRDFIKEKSTGAPGMLVIDTEGFDLFVLKGYPWENKIPDIIIAEFEDNKTIPLGYSWYDLADFLADKGYHIIVSEWKPIVRYGIKHTWRELKFYPCVLEDENGWGNLIAFKNRKTMFDFLETLR